jgi:hypothetical protein
MTSFVLATGARLNTLLINTYYFELAQTLSGYTGDSKPSCLETY